MSEHAGPGITADAPEWASAHVLPWWTLTAGECVRSLLTNHERGLSEKEAHDRFQRVGPNELPGEEKKSLWTMFLEQFEDLLVRILLAAAFVSFLLALSDSGGWQNFVEPLVILLILIFNAVISTWQERSAEGAIEALRQYQCEVAKVWRHDEEQLEGRLRTLQGSSLVPGDIVDVSVGDRVPADVRILDILSTTLWADQSLLTGESVSVLKQVAPVHGGDVVNQDKTNVLFSGTTVVRGRCRGVVVATGKHTEIGKIRGAIKGKRDERTPLTVKLDEFSELLSKLILVVCVAVWAINVNHFRDPAHGGSWLKGAIYYFKIAVALAVAAIPEGLPAVITTCLALGTARMARKNAIVRTLPSVETLGCTSVICSDKTGTLTTNQMLASRFMVVSERGRTATYSVSGTTYRPVGVITSEDGLGCQGRSLGAAVRALAEVAALCNDASVEVVHCGGKTHYEKVGEATEAALVVLVEKLDVHSCKHGKQATKEMRQRYPRLATLEFTRERKSMGVVVAYGAGKRLLVKGAPESVLARCTHYLSQEGNVKQLDQATRDLVAAWYARNAALRCLSFAYRDLDDEDAEALLTLDVNDFANVETKMVFAGMAGLLDPPRTEVVDAIRMCRLAGIRVIMVTGDNQQTAEHIARSIGLLVEEDDSAKTCFTGLEFSAMDDSTKLDVVKRAKLFARVEPTHKSEIIEYLQKLNEISAMTGDGVNDAPALKRAEIGIAMGSGTAVAKSASDMVLADDDFSTIVLAVEEGRAIFNNMKQFIRYLISSNIGEVVCIFLTAALGLPEALIPVQLLWVNLVTDGLPATALGFNPPDADIMEKPPRRPTEPLITRWLLVRYVLIGTYVGVATVLSSCWWYMKSDRGPRLAFSLLANHFKCNSPEFLAAGNRDACQAFLNVERPEAPMTMALSVLVTIEMLNALNSLSENQSLLVMPPWRNRWLVAACALSMLQHFLIVYVAPFNSIFHTCPLTRQEWSAVLKLSLPVVLIDEILKLISRCYLDCQSGRNRKRILMEVAALIGVWSCYLGWLHSSPIFT